MKIAIMSDIHDNIWKLSDALLRTGEAKALLFLGDFCAPFTLKQMAENFDGPVHVVWGNNDGDKWLLTRIANEAGNVTLYGEFADINIEGRHIAMTHYPHIARPLADGGEYDLVLYGHDHNVRLERVKNTLLLNPGEVMGRLGKSTFALYDTVSGDAEIVEVP
jgi:uncharacterized protein